jgi:hypothetical protein
MPVNGRRCPVLTLSSAVPGHGQITEKDEGTRKTARLLRYKTIRPPVRMQDCGHGADLLAIQKFLIAREDRL